MNFGEIREQVEGAIGAAIHAAVLAGWIDTAQKEIAKRYGKRVRYWYPPVLTNLATDITSEPDTIIPDDAMMLPAAPSAVMIGDGGLYEIVTYDEIDHQEMRGVGRGEQGTNAEPWPLGTEIRALPVSSKEYMLPSDILTLHEVRDENNNIMFNYNISPDYYISAHTSGLYFISYTRIPTRIDCADNGFEIEVSDIFENDIVQFCISRHWQAVAEGIPGEENKASALMSEFTQSIERSANHLKRIPNQQYTIGIELW